MYKKAIIRKGKQMDLAYCSVSILVYEDVLKLISYQINAN